MQRQALGGGASGRRARRASFRTPPLAPAWAAACLIGALAASPAEAQEGDRQALDPGDVLIELFNRAASGDGDRHLPYVLNALKQALANDDLIAVMRLIDREYFNAQFALYIADGADPGEALHRFTCEFFSVCDLSKNYTVVDIVSAHVLGIEPLEDGSSGLIAVRLELRMWDGLTIYSVIYYNPRTARLSAARG